MISCFFEGFAGDISGGCLCIEADQMWRKIGNSMPEDEVKEEK